jgi:YVTN family beta-propeller protein
VLIAAGGDEETPAHCYVCDFGLTKQALSVSGLTETGQFVGTIDYVAPEQIQGLPVDRRADVYSLGCVLYECLAGAPPFKRGAEVAVMWAHVQEPPPKVTETRTDLPPGVDEVVARAMAKKPEDRYASCGDVAADVRGELGLASGEFTGLTGPRIRPADVGAGLQRSRRMRLVAGVAAGAVAAAILAFVLLTRGSGGEVGTITDHSLVRVDPATNEVAGVVAVGAQPESVAFSQQEGLWVANFGERTVQRIDPETNTVLRTEGGITGNPTGIAVGGGFVWVTNGFAGTVIKVDPTTQATTSIEVGTGAKGVAFGEDALWVVNNQDNTLSRIDPSSEAVTVVEIATFAEEGQETGPAAVAVGAGSVWVSNSLGHSVWRFDPTNLEADPVRINLQGNPGNLTFGEGAVWVTNPDQDSIVRINPAENGQVTIPCTCNNPVGISAGGGAVWVASSLDGKLTRIDPRTRKVVTQVTLGFSPAGVAVSPGAVWVAVRAA